jgi:hypothetical protein
LRIKADGRFFGLDLATLFTGLAMAAIAAFLMA